MKNGLFAYLVDSSLLVYPDLHIMTLGIELSRYYYIQVEINQRVFYESEDLIPGPGPRRLQA